PFRAPYSRIGNLMAELPYSFIYELRSTPAAPKPYLTGLRRPSAERTTTQICESPASAQPKWKNRRQHSFEYGSGGTGKSTDHRESGMARREQPAEASKSRCWWR